MANLKNDPDYQSYLSQLEQQNGLPSGLLSTQMAAESGGNPNAKSSAGALGAFQFLPSTAKQYGIDPTDPYQAAQGAARLNADNLAKYNGDLPSALAAYNWGSGNVDRKGLQNAPSETRNYVSKIVSGLSNFIVPSAQASEMPDLSHLSDEQLQAIAGKQSYTNQSPQQQVFGDVAAEDGQKSQVDPSIPHIMVNKVPDLSQVSDDQLQAIASGAPRGAMVDQDVQDMSQPGASGALSQLGAYGLNAMQAIPIVGPYTDEAASAVGALAGFGQGNDFSQRYGNLQQRQQATREAGTMMQPTLQTPSYLPNITPTGLGQVGAAMSVLPASAESDVATLASKAPFLTKIPLALGKLAPSIEASTIPGAIFKSSLAGAAGGALSGYGLGDAFSDNNDARLAGAGAGATLGGLIGAGGGAIQSIAQKVANPIRQITSDELRADASATYKAAESAGGVLKPEVTDSFVSQAQKLAPQTEAGKTVFGDSAVTKLVDRIKALGGKPLSLSEVQELDEGLGQEIEKNVLPTGKLNSDGQKLFDLQTKLRTAVNDATEDNVVGSKAGFDALKTARQKWAASIRGSEIERIINRGDLSDNPATTIRAGFRSLANNPARLKFYNAEQQKLIKQAAKPSLGQEALRVIGSRLLAIGSTGAGFAMGGPVGAAAAGLGTTATGAVARNIAGSMQSAQGKKVLNAVLGNKGPKYKITPTLTTNIKKNP